MEILVMSSTFPSAELDGSRPRFVFDLANAVGSHANVTALVPHHPGAPLSERMGSVTVERFRYWLPTAKQRLTPNMREQMSRSLLARVQVPFFVAAQAISLVRCLRRRKIHVVNAHWLVPQGLSAALVRLLSNRFRLALHVHAGDVYFLTKRLGGRRIARFVVSRSDLIFADGSHVRDTLDALLGYPSGALLQPMGVDRRLFATPHTDRPGEATRFAAGYVLFVGRFVQKKGARFLLRAMAELRTANPGLGLILIGSGPEEDALRREARRLALDDRVLFVGSRPHREVVAFLRHCRVAAVPSIIDDRGETEGMPTVVAEAMTAGTLVVGSNVDGIPDLLRDGENGWLCRPRDSIDLAAKIQAALTARDQEAVRRAARATALQLDWPVLGAQYFRRLETIVRGNSEASSGS